MTSLVARHAPETTIKTVRSADGTRIAFEQSGAGPALILVGAALADHAGSAKLARLLAERFTVLNYDRRGRGKSGDTPPYAVEREVEDLEALVGAAGGSAFLFGSSSGAALALEAASKLGTKARGLALYEPPFIVDGSRLPMPDDFAERVRALVAAGRRSEAVAFFFHQGMGIPAVFVTLMRLLMPGWPHMVGMAHTIPYDLAVLAGTQTGKPLPAKRWEASVPTVVMVGGRSEAFFHTGAKALVELLPHARYRSLAGRGHEAVLMAPKALAAVISEIFLRPSSTQAERSGQESATGNGAQAARAPEKQEAR